MTPAIGLHCSHEQIPPSRLLRHAREAEAAGFDAGMCSDHFAPWSERQGESGFAWSFLGAALQATALPWGVVNAPGQRYHPAIVAQAAATLCELFPGRLWVALGTGEFSNEHITGAPWPPKRVRAARLRECVDVMRALFAGEVVDHDGLVRVDRAKLWTLPAEPPALVGAAVSPETARWCGGWADGLATINQPRERLERVIAAFREGGGEGKPVHLQVHLSWAPTEEEALADRARPVAHERLRAAAVLGPRHRRAVRRGRAATCVPRTCAARCSCRPTSAATPRGCRSWPRSASTRSSCTTSGRTSRRSSPPSPSTCCRSCAREPRGDRRRLVEERRRLLPGRRDVPGRRRGRLRRPRGLCERIDYLAGIGVSCLWLMPFYPSVQRDDGYDITDFYGVDPRLGTHGDLVDMIRTARDRGIRVIADLVPNHTSDRHPWFQAAREGRDNPYHDFYVWADEKPAEKPGDVVFPDQESSNWAYDRKARRWYLHRFYSHQPDLNVANPEVRDEIAQVAGFWLQQGLEGFRLDAVPFLIEPTGMPRGAIEDPHELLRDLRRAMGRRNGSSILLGEVNLAPEEQARFFGGTGGEQLDMLFAFTVNQAMYLALAREDAGPLAAALAALPEIPADCQWAHFVRNHDELTLDKLSEEERQEVFAAFGPEPEMQLYGRGLRRRLPGMLGGDPRRIRLAYSLMFSLPGTPVLFYGEEIGMAENPDIEGRYAVRAPMQWSAEPNAGFTTADEPGRPVLADGPFGYPDVNVAAQRRDPGSLLNWIERLIRRRRECPELGWGAWALLEQDDPAVFAHRADWDGSTIVALHNLAGRATEARLALDGEGVLVDLFSADEHALAPDLRLTLEPHGHRWFRVRRPGQRVAP